MTFLRPRALTAFAFSLLSPALASADAPIAVPTEARTPVEDEAIWRPTMELATTSPLVVASVIAAPYATGRYSFYGWQNMLVEGLGVTAVFGAALAGVGTGGAGSSDESLTLVALAGTGMYVAGGLVVHLLHEKPAKAIGSLGFTIGLPLTGLAAGGLVSEGLCPTVSMSPSRHEACVEENLAWGALTGVLVAPLFDGLILGWEKRGSPFGSNESPKPTWLPAVIPISGGLALGIAGTM